MARGPEPLVVIVGPTHPYTGGIAQHTTRLATELEARSVSVRVESWKAQYPKSLYPGPDRVPDNQPEVGVASDVREKLAWYSPLSWWTTGKRARLSHHLVLTVPTSFHAVPYFVLLMALGGKTESIAIVHNVFPHEPGPLDKFLMRGLLKIVDRVVVHGERARETAVGLEVAPEAITVSSLPSPWTQRASPRSPSAQKGSIRLIFFGTIRHYKGLDILLQALSFVPDLELLVAGEFWRERAPYDALISSLGLSARVRIRDGYVAASDFADVFAEADVAVLPYRSGTGSIVKDLAFSHGLPVIATDVGAIAEGINPGRNGDVVQAGNTEALVAALKKASSRRTIRRWQKNVAAQRDTNALKWESYCEAILGKSREEGQ